MRASIVTALLVVAGCGSPQPSAGRAIPTWPALCPGTRTLHAHEHFGRMIQEASGCWRGQLPVRPCDSVVHPDVIGLWGSDAGGFGGPLRQDSCRVTWS
jgi:hypothetical protein